MCGVAGPACRCAALVLLLSLRDGRVWDVSKRKEGRTRTLAGHGSFVVGSPADCDGAIAVAATLTNDSRHEDSNYNSFKVHVAAPGSNVLTTFPPNTYGNYGATSGASPIAAGTAALLASRGYNSRYIYDMILGNTKNLDWLAQDGKTILRGRVDAGRAVKDFRTVGSSTFSGDFNGDGRADVLVAHEYNTGCCGLWVWLSTGSSLSSALWHGGPSTCSYDVRSARFAVGDLNGDGRSDLISTFDYHHLGEAQRTRVWVWLSTGSSFSAPANWWTSAVGGWDWARHQLMAGDVTGDGRADVVMSYDYGSDGTRLWVWPPTGSGLGNPVQWWQGTTFDASRTRFMIGECSGDGRADIVGWHERPAGGRVAWGSSSAYAWTSTGSSFASQGVRWTASGAAYPKWRVSTTMGNVTTGDSRADVIIHYDQLQQTSQVRILISGSSTCSFSLSDSWWQSGTHAFDFNRSKILSGNVNGSGPADLMVFYDLTSTLGAGSSAWYAFTSNGSSLTSQGAWWTSSPGGFDWYKGKPQ